jgi:hypothetical protein
MGTNLIDFEDRNSGDFIINQYAGPPWYVIFDGGGIIETDPPIAHSGKHYLRVYRAEFSTFSPLKILFTRGQKHVSLFAGTVSPEGSTIVGTLVAQDTQAKNIAHDGPKLIKPNACVTNFDVSAPPNTIATVTLLAYGFDGAGQPFDPDQVVDDIYFEADPEPAARPITVEPGLYWHILYGVTLGQGGVILGPQGPRPVPPVGPLLPPEPEVKNALIALLAGEVARVIDDPSAASEIERAAVRSAGVQLGKLMERLDRTAIARETR